MSALNAPLGPRHSVAAWSNLFLGSESFFQQQDAGPNQSRGTCRRLFEMLCKGVFRSRWEVFATEEAAWNGLIENIGYLFHCASVQFHGAHPPDFIGPNFLFWLRVYCVFTQRFSEENIAIEEVYILATFITLVITARVNREEHRERHREAGPGQDSVWHSLTTYDIDIFMLCLMSKEGKYAHLGTESLNIRRLFPNFTHPENSEDLMRQRITQRRKLALTHGVSRVHVASYSGNDTLTATQKEVIQKIHDSIPDVLVKERELGEMYRRVTTAWYIPEPLST